MNILHSQSQKNSINSNYSSNDINDTMTLGQLSRTPSVKDLTQLFEDKIAKEKFEISRENEIKAMAKERGATWSGARRCLSKPQITTQSIKDSNDYWTTAENMKRRYIKRPSLKEIYQTSSENLGRAANRLKQSVSNMVERSSLKVNNQNIKKVDVRKEFRNAFLNESDPKKRLKTMWECAFSMSDKMLLKQVNNLYFNQNGKEKIELTKEQKSEILKFVAQMIECGFATNRTLVKYHYLILNLKTDAQNDSKLNADGEALNKAYAKVYAMKPKSYQMLLERCIELGKNAGFKEEELIHSFLFKSYGIDFRKDFLLAGPWMKFGQDSAALINQMEKIFTAKGCPVGKKKAILEFAKQGIEQGVLKDSNMNHLKAQLSMQSLILSGKNDKNPTIKKLATDLELAKTQVLKAKDIVYSIEVNANNSDLDAQFEKIAIGAKKKSLRDQNFIKDFAEDLATITFNTRNSIQPSEFHRQAWTKDNASEIAPNITFAIDTFNRISDFVMDQIVRRGGVDGENERARVYSAFVEIAKELIETHHDYHSAYAIFCGLNNQCVSRLKIKESEKTKKTRENIAQLFDFQKNFKNVRDAYKNCEQNQLSFTQIISTLTKDFTFVSDGNPDHIENKINFDKFGMAKAIHNDAMKIQGKPKCLHYDVIGMKLFYNNLNERDIRSKKLASQMS